MITAPPNTELSASVSTLKEMAASSAGAIREALVAVGDPRAHASMHITSEATRSQTDVSSALPATTWYQFCRVVEEVCSWIEESGDGFSTSSDCDLRGHDPY